MLNFFKIPKINFLHSESFIGILKALDDSRCGNKQILKMLEFKNPNKLLTYVQEKLLAIIFFQGKDIKMT